MTTVTSKIPNNFLLADITAEVNRMHKMTGERMLHIGLSPTGYMVSRNQDDTKQYPVRITSINRRG